MVVDILKKSWLYIQVHLIGTWKCLQESIWDRQGPLRGLPDMSDKVVVITGGGRGMGLEAAKKFVSLGCKVFLGVRSPAQVEEKFRQILDPAQMEKVVCLKLDLMSTSSVKTFALELLNRTSTIHVLLNNGGIMFGPRSLTSEDGFDNQMATNYFGHFLLTSLLLKTLKSTSDSQNLETRIVNVSSAAHFIGAFIDVDDLAFKKFYSTHHAYGVSKASQIMFTKQLARRLKSQGCEKVIVNCIHPGIVRTDLLKNEWYVRLLDFVLRFFLKTPSQGADTLVHAAVLATNSGLYLENFKPTWNASFVDHASKQEALWQVSCDLLNIQEFGNHSMSGHDI